MLRQTRSFENLAAMHVHVVDDRRSIGFFDVFQPSQFPRIRTDARGPFKVLVIERSERKRKWRTTSVAFFPFTASAFYDYSKTYHQRLSNDLTRLHLSTSRHHLTVSIVHSNKHSRHEQNNLAEPKEFLLRHRKPKKDSFTKDLRCKKTGDQNRRSTFSCHLHTWELGISHPHIEGRFVRRLAAYLPQITAEGIGLDFAFDVKCKSTGEANKH